MKHKGTKNEYLEERSRDLMRAYDEYIESCDYVSMTDVYRKVANMPSRRFWISDVRARNVIAAMMRGEPALEGMWPVRREMFEEIFRRVVKLKGERPWLSLLEICSIVVEQPAPKFYLAPETVKFYICRTRREWVNAKIERLCKIVEDYG